MIWCRSSRGSASVLLGVIATRLVLASPLAPRLAAINPTGRLPRVLAFLGRWSLLIYLLHQPILLGLVYPAAAVLQPQIAMRNADFLALVPEHLRGGRHDAGALHHLLPVRAGKASRTTISGTPSIPAW